MMLTKKQTRTLEAYFKNYATDMDYRKPCKWCKRFKDAEFKHCLNCGRIFDE